ncbi:MAG: fumarate hydratase [Oscillospiraceae bacterium]|nr:fumarate hydratase [Oscillospiraceae bacterium]
MKEIHYTQIVAAVRNLCIKANTVLPQDLCSALRAARTAEESPVGQAILGDLEENFTFAAEKGLPICQDTGMAVVFVKLGQEVRLIGGSLQDAVNEGVALGYTEGHLRCSVVADPLRRENTGNNTPAVLHLELTTGDELELTVAPKGFGSENMTRLKMFNPSATREDIIAFVAEAVEAAGANPCPPIVVGVGLGGTSEVATLLAKKALLRPVDRCSDDPFYAGMEAEMKERINALGIGPQGLGGRVTALSVAILASPTHIAGMPCAVNLGCHVTRHASVTL